MISPFEVRAGCTIGWPGHACAQSRVPSAGMNNSKAQVNITCTGLLTGIAGTALRATLFSLQPITR
jgi:hypothetical protein